MKIEYTDNLSNINNNINLRSIIKNGVVSVPEYDFVDEPVDEIFINNKQFIEELEKNVSIEDINKMNIILNDNDTSNNFFEDVTDDLSKNGLVFVSTKNNNNIDIDNSIIITLDQQYTAGSDTLVFAPYDNTRIGNSDSLALAVKASFINNGLNVGNILCGKTGYREENGNVVTCVPTDTEEAIDKKNDTSFVTISLGTQNIDSSVVAKSIIESLKRYAYYINNYDLGSDLIYRANSNDSVEMVAEYFGTSDFDLKLYNNIGDQDIFDSQAIINPYVKDLVVFENKHVILDNNSLLK